MFVVFEMAGELVYLAAAEGTKLPGEQAAVPFLKSGRLVLQPVVTRAKQDCLRPSISEDLRVS